MAMLTRKEADAARQRERYANDPEYRERLRMRQNENNARYKERQRELKARKVSRGPVARTCDNCVRKLTCMINDMCLTNGKRFFANNYGEDA